MRIRRDLPETGLKTARFLELSGQSIFPDREIIPPGLPRILLSARIEGKLGPIRFLYCYCSFLLVDSGTRLSEQTPGWREIGRIPHPHLRKWLHKNALHGNMKRYDASRPMRLKNCIGDDHYRRAKSYSDRYSFSALVHE
jgi:hypothetical protein